MKKITVLFLCFVLFASAFSASALSANGLSARDLSSCGVRSLRAYRVAASPVLDGVIASGEYGGALSDFSLGSGAFLTDLTGEVLLDPGTDPVYRDAVVSAVLAYDGDFLYFAFTLSLPASGAVPLLQGEKRLGAGFCFAIGFSPESDLAAAQSRLLNQYDFDPDLIPTGNAVFGRDMKGERIAASLDSLPAVSPQLSNRWEPYTDNGVTVGGTLWNADCCAAHAVMRSPSPGVLTGEIAVPFADALLSVTPGAREEAAKEIASGVFTGSVSFRIPVQNGVFLSNARPASSVYTDEGASLPDAFLAAHPAAQPNVNRIGFLPSPVYFGQSVPPVQTAEPTEDPTETQDPAVPTVSTAPPVTAPGAQTDPPDFSDSDPAETGQTPQNSVPASQNTAPLPS